MDRTDPSSRSERSAESLRRPSASHETVAEAVFLEALAMPCEARESFLSQRLPEDSGLRRVIREFLEHHEEAGRDSAFLGAIVPDWLAVDWWVGDEIASANARYRILELLGKNKITIIF